MYPSGANTGRVAAALYWMTSSGVDSLNPHLSQPHTGKMNLSTVHLQLAFSLLQQDCFLCRVFFSLLHFVQHAHLEFSVHEETGK